MKILFTGHFNPEYNRTKIIIAGLRSMGVEVDIFNYPKKKKLNKSELRTVMEEADWIFLPSFTHTDLPFIRKLSSKPIIFDPLISRYLTKVFDHKSVSRYSPRAYKNYLKDSRALKRADLILADTQSHKNYFIEKFRVPPEKIKVVPVGVIGKDFYPMDMNSELDKQIIVGFYGSFLPLHGIDVIIEAANILKSNKRIKFRLIGSGDLADKMKLLAKNKNIENIEFIDWISYTELNQEINNFDIALGIFGSSKKANMVIPNKIFHYAACEKVIISMRSVAITEIFEHDKNIYLCEPKPESLSNAILNLQDASKRKEIAGSANKMVTEEYSERKIAENILSFISDYPIGS